jgi:hypothetical protein
MLRPETARMLENLPLGRTDQKQLWEILSRVMTVPTGNQRNVLHGILEELNSANLIKIPRSPSALDKGSLPHLPKWIVRTRLRVAKEYVENIIWSPELMFLASKRKQADSQWLQLDKWLKENRGKTLLRKPVRERSLDIFSDEKTLDALLRSQAFKDGLISLDTLQCYYVPEPIPWEPGPLGSETLDGLCIENATTYDTVVKFNKQAGLWGYVAYGRGNGFATAVEGILPVMERYGQRRLLYFGDTDLEGIEIACRGSKKLAASGKILELDACLYRLLMKHGKKAPAKSGGTLSPDALELISKAGLEDLIIIFAENLRIAQEWVGYRELNGLTLLMTVFFLAVTGIFSCSCSPHQYTCWWGT